MKQYLIIGNSAAGISACEAVRRKDKESKIIILSDEDYPGYCRCLISYYLAGDVKEDKLLYKPDSFYKDNNIGVLLNKRVRQVDPKKNRVTCEDKSRFSYDSLLIATGAHPKFPEIKGIKKKSVFGFRTIKDAKNIETLLPVTKTAAILGGGLVGLKAAYALQKRGIAVKVMVKSSQILSQMLDFEAALMVQKKLEQNGIEIVLHEGVAEVIGNGDIKAIKLDSGKALECSLIVVGKGVEPNIDLVRDSEVKFNTGIIANNLMQTSVSNIFTAGDVCESFDLTSGKSCLNALWPVAVEQGRVAGLNLAGGKSNYDGSLGMNSIEFFGLPVISLGIYKNKQDCSAYEELKLLDAKSGIYKKLILRDKIIVGAILVGEIKNSGIILRLIKEKIEVSPFKHKLLQENFGYPDIVDFIKEKERVYV